MNNTAKSKTIAKNTLILYFRMIFLMFVSLYTSRVILKALGVEDYGIYNVVGGFVSMFALISAALTSACSRFLNFEMGKGDAERQNVVFSTTVIIQFTLAVIVFVIAEIFGIWYLNNVMVLPIERLTSANWCFQFSVFTFCMNLITVPYNASIIAHEKMNVFAYVSIYEGLAKLGISFLIFWEPFDRLIFYALMLLVVQVSVMFSYQYFCRRNFYECHFKRVFDKRLLNNMLSYSVWHLVGNSATVLKTHGVNIVLNLFFGPVVNAARGIASQVENAVSQFAGNFMMAMNPQITQSYARGDFKYMHTLINMGSRFSFYMLFILSFPIIINAEFLLSIWLNEVPEYATVFVKISMVSMMITSLSRTLITAQNATGNVRNYQLVVGGILLLNMPFSYIVLRLGCSPYSVIVVAVLVECLTLVARLLMLTVEQFSVCHYFKTVVVNCAVVFVVPFAIGYLFYTSLDINLVTFMTNVLIDLLLAILSVYLLGCTRNDRMFIHAQVAKIFIKFRH